jgi:hypothetical protein
VARYEGTFEDVEGLALYGDDLRSWLRQLATEYHSAAAEPS